MSDKSEGKYQVIPNGFVYLWKLAGWQEAEHGDHTTLMKRDRDDDGVHRRADDRAA